MKKFSFIYEIPLFYLIIFSLNQLFIPDAPAFVGIYNFPFPHPFWVGIFIFSIRYGILGGLSSGIFSGGSYLAITFYLGDLYLFEELAFFTLPIFFVIGGSILGSIIQSFKKEKKEMFKVKRALLDKIEVKKDEVEVLKEIKGHLEKRISTKMSTLITLYEGARKLESIQVSELYDSILSFVEKTLGAEEVGLYLKTKNGWELISSKGWASENSWKRKYNFNEGLVGIAGSKNKIVSVRDFISGFLKEDFHSMNSINDCIVAGPIRGKEQDEVIAVVAIQSIPFLKFTSATINLFNFLLGWFSRSLVRAEYIHTLKSHEILDPDFDVYSFEYFLKRFNQELSRSKTYYLPLSLLMVKVEGFDGFQKDKRHSIQILISEILKKNCRDMDVISSFNEKDIPFSALLITANDKKADLIKNAILEELNAIHVLSRINIKIGVSSFSPQNNSYESMLFQIKKSFENAA